MPVVFSDAIPQDARTREWWYNALDAAVTLEIHEVLARKNSGTVVYAFERALQGPALDMMLRGFSIDPVWRSRSITELAAREAKLEAILDRLARAVWSKPLNPRSPKQLLEFFYGELRLPEVWTSKKGVRKLSTDREAMEKLSDYYLARPFINTILAARDTRKQLGVLRTGIDPDGRMRCTYNVCGTETGRWASSQNVFGRGTNLQNITGKLRRMFVADEGMILLYVDGEQAESRAVGVIEGILFDDWTYLDACEAGDLHTIVTQMTWENLPWTGNLKADREIAEQLFYRHFTYRDMAKRGGHGTNYYGKPWTMAKHLKVPRGLIEEFQTKYFSAFPAHARWHAWVAQQLITKQSITTFMGRERTFYGRPNDEATLRKAIAYEPQSAVGDIVNQGMFQVWKKFPQVQMLGQIHDAFLCQIPQDRLDLIDPICQAFQVPITLPNGRTFVIPSEAKLGWNWADEDGKRKTFSDGNPDGLRKWKGRDERTRTENPEADLLDRVLF